MKRVGRLAVVEESSDVDMACEPPRASVPGQSFPAAFRRNLVTKKDETAAASAVAASPLEASPGRVKDEAAADAERMFASMSEQDILKAQEEIRQLASSKTVELLQRRAARRLAGGTNLEPPVVAGLPDAEVQPSRPLVMDRELMLPPIEHEKLAWTDPESKQAPREKEPDFAHSVRVQSFRFGLKGEIMDPNAASEETYNAGLHHHGEEPEKAGYTLEELLTLMRSQNEPQNLFAAQILLHIAEGVLRGDFANELLYPEAGPRSMTIGEGILWEVLSMNMLVPIRLCCFKRSLALRDACLQLISALVAALADDSELTQHAAESHWGVIVFPSAPLFEDDGSEEMEKLDGLRCMVRQLDFLPLLDAGTAAGLNCLCKVAGHSRSLGLLLLSRSELVDVAASKGLQEAPALAMRLFRLLLSCDARHTRTLEEKQVTSACWRHFLASADQSLEQIEAALLLRVLLLFGSQTNVLVDTLSELLTRVVGKKMRPWLPCLLCDALLVSGAGANVEKLMEALLHGSVGNCVLEGDASAVLHLAATLSKRCGVEIRPVVAPLLAKLEKGGHSVWLAAMRLANSSPNVLKELPSWLWNSERVKLVAKTLSPPQPQADKVNRFQTQRRLRTLVRDRERILLVREMLIAGHGVLDDPIALFGMAFDLVSRLAIVGADEWLLLELLERVLLNPLFLERVAKQVMQKEYEESESLRQSKMLCSALLGGVRSAWFPDEAWLNRCRSVCGESEAGSPRPDGLVAGESLCMASFVGADWLFSLCKSENGDTVRAAMQMLLLAELVRSCQSLAIMSNTSKLIKVNAEKTKKKQNKHFFFFFYV
jgi:hypothetical protein